MRYKNITILLIASFLMMILMGSVYAYSVFRSEIESIYKVGSLLSGIPYMTSLFFYALSMFISGRYMKSNHLRRFVFIGSLIITTGWFLSSISTNIYIFTITYGFLIGTGVGMIYGVPIYMIQRIYPQKSGFYTGLVLLGFGISPLISAPIGNYLLTKTNLSNVFMIFGLAVLFLQVPLAAIFKLDYQDQNQLPTDQNLTNLKLIFKQIYLVFVLLSTIGLMMIGLSYQIGTTHYGFRREQVTIALSFFAICNGLSRPLFGYLIDKKGFKYTAFFSLSLITVAAIIGLVNKGEYLSLYVISFGLFWFNLGAWLAIIPSAVKKIYGMSNYSKIYGKIFTAYGVGAIIGTFLSGIIMDFFNQTTYIYLLILMIIFMSIWLIKKLDFNI